MVNLLDQAFKAMVDNLKIPSMFIQEISNSETAEDNINAYRDKLREEHIDNCEKEDYNYQTGVFYIDIVQELEKMGDFIINISQSRLEKEVV
jgi:phosphate:Na+ symporter